LNLSGFGVCYAKSNFVPNEFETELAALKEKLLIMASHAEAAVNRAIKALLKRDDVLARRTREEDSVIGRLEMEIDEAGIKLLAKQPALLDLRLIAMAMKISRDLERVGDEATTISRRVIDLSQEPPLKQQVDIPSMAAQALAMLKESLDAFVYRDAVKARAVIPNDQRVDDLNRRLHEELARGMAERPETINRCVNLMVISKSIERIRDHATNIAEEVVFLYEGCDIRHAGKGEAST